MSRRTVNDPAEVSSNRFFGEYSLQPLVKLFRAITFNIHLYLVMRTLFECESRPPIFHQPFTHRYSNLFIKIGFNAV